MKLAQITVAIIALSASLASAESIDCTVGALHVHATAISDRTFCLSVNASGEATPRASAFLDASVRREPVGRVTASGATRTLQTAGGALMIDTAAGTYAVVDAHGTTIAPAAPIASVAQRDGKPELLLRVGWPQDRPFVVYASGNGGDALAQHSVNAHVGNGVAVQPFFWAPAGLATFVVGESDNAQPTCDGRVERDAVTWATPGASADLYVMLAPTLADATPALLDLTGHPAVPPRWTFGYLQSRWGWRDRADVDDVARQFVDRKLPVDAFIFDFEWYTKTPDYAVPPRGEADFSDFAFNPQLFPAPAEQIKALHDAGIHAVGIRKPRIGNADTLKFIRAKGWDISAKTGDQWDARGLDFAKPDLRAWYADQLKPLLNVGIDGWWDDEGEFTFSNYFSWNQAERAALDLVRPNARLWTLDRAFSPGAARLGATAWTGDVQANWDALRKTPAALLNWSLAGMPFAGCDIGGFHGEPSPELFVRWMEAGTCFPIMRSHAEHDVTPHFPWLYGADAEVAMRGALERRYRFIPMLYSLAHACHETGVPIVRPMAMAFPGDASVAENVSEWMVGSSLLAAPVLAPGGARSVALPAGDWYDFATNEKVAGARDVALNVPLDASPMYVRAGSILPLAPVVMHTRDLPGGPLEVRVYPGGDATFALVEDDGETLDYLKGAIRRTTFTWSDASGELSWTRDGAYDGPACFKTFRVVVAAGPTTAERELSASGKVSTR